MKKDSIQTRKRKPKGQGKNKKTKQAKSNNGSSAANSPNMSSCSGLQFVGQMEGGPTVTTVSQSSLDTSVSDSNNSVINLNDRTILGGRITHSPPIAKDKNSSASSESANGSRYSSLDETNALYQGEAATANYFSNSTGYTPPMFMAPGGVDPMAKYYQRASNSPTPSGANFHSAASFIDNRSEAGYQGALDINTYNDIQKSLYQGSVPTRPYRHLQHHHPYNRPAYVKSDASVA